VPGDRIREVNGVATPTWEKAEEEYGKALQSSGVQFSIEHDGTVGRFSVPSRQQKDIDAFSWYTPDMAVIADVVAGQAAARAGLRPDDLVVSVNGKKVSSRTVFIALVQQSKGAEQEITVERGGKLVTTKIRPEASNDKTEDGQPIYRVGVSVTPKPEWSFKKVGFESAVQNATLTTVNWIEDLFGVLGKLFTGKLSVKQLQGVVGIAYQAGRAVQEGTFATVSLMAVISVNLGILNLLPIPILDGGHILLLSIEGIRRRELSLAFKERFIQVGFVFLLLLFGIVMYNDVMRRLTTHS